MKGPGRNSTRLKIRASVAFVASKQAVVEWVWAAREDANVLDVGMFGVEENICV
jgi:hypothetical protein